MFRVLIKTVVFSPKNEVFRKKISCRIINISHEIVKNVTFCFLSKNPKFLEQLYLGFIFNAMKMQSVTALCTIVHTMMLRSNFSSAASAIQSVFHIGILQQECMWMVLLLNTVLQCKTIGMDVESALDTTKEVIRAVLAACFAWECKFLIHLLKQGKNMFVFFIFHRRISCNASNIQVELARRAVKDEVRVSNRVSTSIAIQISWKIISKVLKFEGFD